MTTEPPIAQASAPYILFRNPGVMDLRALKTFGVSVKATDNPIGMFGTGLKYTIAVLLRNKIPFVVMLGQRMVEFSVKKVDFRGQEQEMICIDGEEAGFTTHFGMNWKPEQAFRELYSNCLDEGGTITQAEGSFLNYEDATAIMVFGKEFQDLYIARGLLFLQTEPRQEGRWCDLHDGMTNAIFYRGVKVVEMRTNKALYTWNIKAKIELTEDRTAKYDFMWREHIIKYVTIECNDVDILTRILCAPDGSMEATLDYSDENFERAPGSLFLATVRQLRKDFARGLNPTAYRLYLRHAQDLHTDEGETLDEYDSRILEEAKDLCFRMGFNIREYPIIVKDFLGEGVLGMARDRTIFISRLCLNQGRDRIASTLIEEWIHTKHGLSDFSRAFQDFCLDALVNVGVKLAHYQDMAAKYAPPKPTIPQQDEKEAA